MRNIFDALAGGKFAFNIPLDLTVPSDVVGEDRSQARHQNGLAFGRLEKQLHAQRPTPNYRISNGPSTIDGTRHDTKKHGTSTTLGTINSA